MWSLAFAPDVRFFYSVRQTGEVFVARRGQAPLLLVEPTCMPPETERQLDRLEPATVVVLGGTRTVGDAAARGTTICG